MAPGEQQKVFDFRFLEEASATLLGYFVHNWFMLYLDVIASSLRRLYDHRIIKDLTEPTERGRYSVLFDFTALNVEKASYINGIYFYILACHKGANRGLMNRYDSKQILYLRGFDYEASVATGGKLAVGFSSMDTTQFNWKMGNLLGSHFQIFKALSPKDVYWETAEAQRYFSSEFSNMIALASHPIRSIYLNALSWKDSITHLLDRMDYFVVYVSSVTESVLWELDQLDTDDRRGRVTVVFDEAAIANKTVQLGIRDRMQDEYGDKLIWSKKGQPPAQSVAELREQLSSKFLVTTLDLFEKDIEQHRRRISESSSRLGPGARETYLEWEFHPALDAEKLAHLRDFSASVQDRITARIGEKGIDCLPLFLSDVQLRIFMTLLMGEHHETGRALAAYAAVMDGAIDYYSRPDEKISRLSDHDREIHLALLRDHHGMANHIALRMLAFGKSHEFGDFSGSAVTEYEAIFNLTKAAVAKFFNTAAALANSRQNVF